MLTKGKEPIIVLTGTGRSGTTYMVGLLRRVYGIGFSAEPKDVLQICRFAGLHNLENPNELDLVIDRACQSKVFQHILEKGMVSKVEKERIYHYLDGKTVEGVVVAMFKYVAEIRDADPALPGFKDPVVLEQIRELNQYLPHACYINMLRRGEDVAGSTLRFNWGATNLVAGVLNWRGVLLHAFEDFKSVPPGRVLNLRLEEAESNTEKFTQQLDDFININLGVSQLESLRADISESLKSIRSYSNKGITAWLVTQLARNLNYELGYPVHKMAGWKERIFQIGALPFYLSDRLLRAIRVVKRKLLSS